MLVKGAHITEGFFKGTLHDTGFYRGELWGDQ